MMMERGSNRRANMLARKLQRSADRGEDQMKAVVIHAKGGPEQLVPAEMPDPAPGPGEVVIDVAYAG